MTLTMKESKLTAVNFFIPEDRFSLNFRTEDTIYLNFSPQSSTIFSHSFIKFTKSQKPESNIPYLLDNKGGVFVLDMEIKKNELCYEITNISSDEASIKVTHRCLNNPVIERTVPKKSILEEQSKIKDEIKDILKMDNLLFLKKGAFSGNRKK